MKRISWTLVLMNLLAFAGFSFAQNSQLQSGKEIYITEPVAKNRVLAAGKISVEAPIGGDLIGVGGEVRINQAIGQDVLLLGGDLELNKAPGQDARIVGGKITVTDNVPGDLIITGGEVLITDAVTIGGDLIVAGGKVDMNGTVKGNVDAAAGELLMYGPVEGALNVKGGKVVMAARVAGESKIAAENLEIRSTARFENNVLYWNKSGSADFGAALAEGVKANFNEALKAKYSEWESKSRLFARRITPAVMAYKLASGILLVGLLIAFFGGFFGRIGGSARTEMGKNFGIGLLYILGIPAVIGVAAITIVGLPAAFAVGGVYGASMAVAGALTAVVGAYELNTILNKDWSKGRMLLVSVGIFIGLKALAAIPVLGSLGVFVLTAIAFGFLIQAMRGKVKPIEKTPQTDSMVEDMV